MGICTYNKSIVLIAGRAVAAISNYSLTAFIDIQYCVFQRTCWGKMRELELDKTL